MVKSKGHDDTRLYFDRETGLLVKIARFTKSGGATVEKEYLYSNHKEINGLQLPTRAVEMINGRKFSEIKSASYKFHSRVSSFSFTRP